MHEAQTMLGIFASYRFEPKGYLCDQTRSPTKNHDAELNAHYIEAYHWSESYLGHDRKLHPDYGEAEKQ